MAVGKIIKGSHFGAALRYLLGEGNEPHEKGNLFATPDEWIAPGYEAGKRARILQTNLSGTNLAQWTKEFEAMDSLRDGGKLKDPMRHIAFSLKPGESLKTAEWQETAEKLLERMGYKDSPYLIVQHRDRDHDHIHIITSRIGYTGKTVSDSFEKEKLRTFAREIEKQHNLTPTPQRAERKTKAKGEIELVKRTGELTLREQIQNQIDEIKGEKRGAADFANQLRQEGVFFKPNIQKSGKVVGVSFAKADENGKVWAFKGSDLGRGYKWSELSKQIDYAPERDAGVFVEAKREAERAERGELTRPVSPAGEKSPAANESIEQPQPGNAPVDASKPRIRLLTTRAERETAIADLIAQHNQEAKSWKGAELAYPQQKRLAKFYRESGDKPPVEKQSARLANIQKRFGEPLPRPRTLLEASMLTLDNLTEAERKGVLRQQIQNINDLTEREARQKPQLEQSSQRETPNASGNPATEQERAGKAFFRQTSEAQERRFITQSCSKEQIQDAIKQMHVADAVQKQIKQSLSEQGIKLEPRAERILSATIDGWAKQSPTDEEQKRVQEIASERGDECAANKLAVASYLLKNSGEQERDELARQLADAASERAEEHQAEKLAAEKQQEKQLEQIQKQEINPDELDRFHHR